MAESKDSWSLDDRIFFTEGKGWGRMLDGRMVCLGEEQTLKKLLERGNKYDIPPDLSPCARLSICEAMEQKFDYKDGYDGIGTPKQHIIGSSPIRTPQHRKTHTRQTSSRKKSTLRKTGRKK